MDPRGTKRGAEKTEVAEPRNKLPRPAPSLPTDPALYSGPFPFYRRPSELGCFSLDAQRQYHGDARALRYYSPPPTNGPGPNFDLRDGYPDRYQPRDEEVQERLDHLLCWLLEHRGRLEGRLGSHPLLFSGEVDCTDPQTPSTQPPTCYVELKTSKEMHSPGQWRSFYRHKLLKWWAQSFLPGVPNVVAGFRNPEGFVSSLKTFPTMKMFDYVRNDRDGWNPSVCMNFCAAFLSFAQSTVVQDDPRLVHLFSWEPGGPVTVSVHRDAPYAFLPIWYVEAMTQDFPSPPKTPSPK
ncbi:decapping and exoribonuclease protein isoform X3 [Macaca fascicularis]|uniref:decapping and exoribonuclease protein isoform X3 n=1 Tax=Macaca fascicularis TaxID=9541 RepID=UPI003D15D107